MRKLYEVLKLLWIQKRIVAAATIWGNTVNKFAKIRELGSSWNHLMSISMKKKNNKKENMNEPAFSSQYLLYLTFKPDL